MALTQKNKVFADVYDGDSDKAAAIAGLSLSYGRKLMQDANCSTIKQSALAVQERIREREGKEPRQEIADRRERQAFWSKNMRDEELEMRHRHEASMLLGKSQADFIDVQADVANMRLQLGAPRKAVGSRTLPGAVIEPVEDSTEDTDDGKDTS